MPVPNTIADLNQAAASNYPLGTDTVGPNLDDYLRAGFAFTRQLFDGTAFLLGSVAGTDTITATCPVPFTAYVAGQTFRFVAGGANATNAVTLNVNGIGAKSVNKFGSVALNQGDIAAGSVVQVTYDGTQFQIDNVAASGAHGQCRLAFVSTTQIRLSRFNGSGIVINGTTQHIPAAGVTYTISGLAANTTYYFYAFMNAGVMTLEPSTTARATGANGVEIKSGDPTRTFVGLARTNGSTQFADVATQRFVRSYFNDPGIIAQNSVTSNVGSSNTTYQELSAGAGGRVEFLAWPDEIVTASYSGMASNNTNSASSYGAIGFDSLTPELGSFSTGFVNGLSSNGQLLCGSVPKKGLTEGYHYATILMKSSAGATTYFCSATSDTWSITLAAKR